MNRETMKDESKFVITEKIEIEGIPCLRFKPIMVQGPLPTVLYYHGWQSNKEYQKLKASVLACYGYQVFVPDAIHHGERGTLNYNDPNITEEYFWKVIIQNVEESKQIIKQVIGKYQADPDRIGVMGGSMGGFSASGVFIENSNLKCLVNFYGSCAWVKAEEVWRKIGHLPPMEPERISWLSKYDPMENKEGLNRRPILMLHGETDATVPVDSQKIFYKEVSSLYQDDPERFRFIEIPRLDHYMTTGMLEEAIDWLKKYL